MIVVSEHAIDQHFKRFGGKDTKEKRVGKANKIRKIVAFGFEIRPKNKMMKLLNNNCVKTKYFQYGGIVAVYANDVVVTVYKYDPENWHNHT